MLENKISISGEHANTLEQTLLSVCKAKRHLRSLIAARSLLRGVRLLFTATEIDAEQIGNSRFMFQRALSERR